MENVKVIDVHEDIFALNESTAEIIREEMTAKGTLFLNVMSSPGSGKTTTLITLIDMLKDEYKIGEMDVDIKTSLDAQRVADATGVRSIQINNGGLCHIDADMTARALAEYDTDGLDILFLENIGNLVCPAEFDTGAHKNIMLLSIPEGHDKPLKYPLMFQVSDLVLINKFDTIDYFNFDLDLVKEYVHNLNPNAKVIPISAKTRYGMDEVVAWVKEELAKVKAQQVK